MVLKTAQLLQICPADANYSCGDQKKNPSTYLSIDLEFFFLKFPCMLQS